MIAITAARVRHFRHCVATFGANVLTALMTARLMIARLMIARLMIARLMIAGLPIACLTVAWPVGPTFAGERPSLRISNAWVPASATTGADVPLLMTITNEAMDADNLLRVSCPVANFAEQHTVDRGEGSPAARPIKSIPIPAAGVLTLATSAYHVMLLQTRQIIAEGDSFSCSMMFQKAGKLETEVHVGRPG